VRFEPSIERERIALELEGALAQGLAARGVCPAARGNLLGLGGQPPRLIGEQVGLGLELDGAVAGLGAGRAEVGAARRRGPAPVRARSWASASVSLRASASASAMRWRSR
jgi:hypothetical protein